MRLPLLRIVVALPLCLALAASAQVTVRKTAGDTVGVDLTGLQAAGNAAAAVRRTLELDLNRSGWMAVAAPGAGAVFVRGSISEAGGEVIFLCQVTDATGRTFINGTFRQPAARAIHLAHHVANEIVVQTTGKPGELTLKIKVKKSKSDQIEIADVVTCKMPQLERKVTYVFALENGAVSQSDPRQRALDLAIKVAAEKAAPITVPEQPKTPATQV